MSDPRPCERCKDTGTVPDIIVRIDGELTNEQLAELRQRFEQAIAARRPHSVILDPPRWVLVKGWHDNGGVEAAYGPYTEEHARWLLTGMLEGTYHNWTLAELQAGPPGNTT
ncbi:MAG: hypothetical protein ACRDPY_15270 [Streptosporangiaceae bacterium]